MTDTVITLIVAIFGSNGLFSLIVLAINRHDRKKDKRNEDVEIMRKAIAALSHDSYFRQCRFILAKDEITEEELENHNYLYNAYHSQGLNGTGDRLHQLVLEKPVKPNV